MFLQNDETETPLKTNNIDIIYNIIEDKCHEVLKRTFFVVVGGAAIALRANHRVDSNFRVRKLGCAIVYCLAVQHATRRHAAREVIFQILFNRLSTAKHLVINNLKLLTPPSYCSRLSKICLQAKIQGKRRGESEKTRKLNSNLGESCEVADGC